MPYFYAGDDAFIVPWHCRATDRLVTDHRIPPMTENDIRWWHIFSGLHNIIMVNLWEACFSFVAENDRTKRKGSAYTERCPHRPLVLSFADAPPCNR